MREVICYLNEIFGIDVNTSSTLVLTLFTFVLGYFITAAASLIAAYRRRKNYRSIFISIVITILNGVKVQSRALEKSSLNFNIKNPEDYRLKTVTITHLENFDRLDFKDVYDSFFSGFENIFSFRKLKAFNLIYAKFSFIKLIEANLFSEINIFNIRFHENEIKWNEQLELLRQFTDELTAQYNGALVNVKFREYLQGIDQIIFVWQQLDNRLQYFKVKTEYIDKALLHNRTYQDFEIADKIILRMNAILLNASHFYDNMDAALNQSSSTLIHYARSYKASDKVAKIALSKL